MHVGIANPRWRGKRSQHSRCMRNHQFYVSGKRPIVQYPWTNRQTDTANGEINTPYLGLYCIIFSVLELMLLVYPHIPQGLYSLSGKMPYSQISWSLEAARLDVLMTVSLWTGISAGLVSRCLSNFRAEQPKPESRGFETSRDLEEPTMTEIVI